MTFKGIPMSEIYEDSSPWLYNTLPVVVCSYHTILYKLNPSLKEPPEPHNSTIKCHWEEGYVRMPYSAKNVFPTKDENGKEGLISRWELIQKTLLQTIENSRAFEVALNAYNFKLPKFHALHHLFEDVFEECESTHFFNKLLPKIIQLALQLPEIIPGCIPFLISDHCKSISLSQKQIACLLANAFLCTFPGRKHLNNYPSINFDSLYSTSTNNDSVVEKIKCIIHYFRRVLQKMPVGTVTFERQHINRSHLPKWDKVDNNLGNVRIHINSQGTIEDDGLGLLQVDFANKLVGGGVLGYGCVQEEIRFVICPELLITRLFTEKLGNHESLIITGVERFSKYKGYGANFQWDGNYVDDTPYDEYGRRRIQITAIDATYFSKPMEQFGSGAILRELNKAYAGFHSRAIGLLPAIATGNWGCGAFGGNVYIKFFIQLMAASAARRSMVYYTFGSETLRDELYDMYTFLANNQITIWQLWRLLCKFVSSQQPIDNFFPFIQQAYFDTKNQLSFVSNLPDISNKKCLNIEPQPSSSKCSETNLNNTQEAKRVNDVKAVKNDSNIECYLDESNIRNSGAEIARKSDSSSKIPNVFHKRKRKSPSSSLNSSSIDLVTLINKIDGSAANQECETTNKPSIGFLDQVDEYIKEQRENTDQAIRVQSSIISDAHEEMDVEEENIVVDVISKRKITDYFKKS